MYDIEISTTEIDKSSLQKEIANSELNQRILSVEITLISIRAWLNAIREQVKKEAPFPLKEYDLVLESLKKVEPDPFPTQVPPVRQKETNENETEEISDEVDSEKEEQTKETKQNENREEEGDREEQDEGPKEIWKTKTPPNLGKSTDTLLVEEILKGANASYRVVESLLDKKADVNAKDDRNFPILIRSIGYRALATGEARACSDEIVFLLIQCRATISARSEAGFPLHHSIDHCRPRVIEELLRNGADVEERGGISQLYELNEIPAFEYAIKTLKYFSNQTTSCLQPLLAGGAVVPDHVFDIMQELKIEHYVRPNVKEQKFFSDIESARFEDICLAFKDIPKLETKLKQLRFQKENKNYTAWQFANECYRNELEISKKTGDYDRAWKLREIRQILYDPEELEFFWFEILGQNIVFASVFGALFGLVFCRYLHEQLDSPSQLENMLFAFTGSAAGAYLYKSIRRKSDPEKPFVTTVLAAVPFLKKIKFFGKKD